MQATSAEAGAGWLTFFRDRTARGLSGVALATRDAHQGLVSAPRCRARRGSAAEFTRDDLDDHHAEDQLAVRADSAAFHL